MVEVHAEMPNQDEHHGETPDNYVSPWMYGLALIVGLVIGSVIPLPL